MIARRSRRRSKDRAARGPNRYRLRRTANDGMQIKTTVEQQTTPDTCPHCHCHCRRIGRPLVARGAKSAAPKPPGECRFGRCCFLPMRQIILPISMRLPSRCLFGYCPADDHENNGGRRAGIGRAHARGQTTAAAAAAAAALSPAGHGVPSIVSRLLPVASSPRPATMCSSGLPPSDTP